MIGSLPRLSPVIGYVRLLSLLVPVMIDIFGWVMLGPIILTSDWHRPQYDTCGRGHHQDQTQKMRKCLRKMENLIKFNCTFNTFVQSTYYNTLQISISAVDASKNNDLAESGSNDEMRVWPPVKIFPDLKYFTTFSPPPSMILISVSPGGVAKIFL